MAEEDYIQKTSNCSSNNNYTTSKKESFTLWMKSLVFHGKGCTVFDSNGAIIYRIDNYENKCCSTEVNLMDLHGNVLFVIRHKRIQVFRHCDGYKRVDSTKNKDIPCFKVRKDHTGLWGYRSCHVTLWCNGAEESSCLKILECPGKSDFKIIDREGRLVAEVRKKQSSTSGVVFGDDVLSLVVEPNIDHSLVMALVTAYCLLHHKL